MGLVCRERQGLPMWLCLFVYLGERQALKLLHLSINGLKTDHVCQKMRIYKLDRIIRVYYKTIKSEHKKQNKWGQSGDNLGLKQKREYSINCNPLILLVPMDRID